MKSNQLISLLEDPQKLKILINMGSVLPIIGQNNKYNILYKTICVGNNKVYVGVHSSTKIQDKYLGCGVSSYDRAVSEDSLRCSYFTRAFKRYGSTSFSRTNLLYFSTPQECFLAESIVVDRDFVDCSMTMNISLGGECPPVNSGSKNGNYGNYWSEEQRLILSNYFKSTQHSVGKKNPMATSCILYELDTHNQLQFDTIQQASIFLEKKKDTLLVTLSDKCEGYITYHKSTKKLYSVFREKFLVNISSTDRDQIILDCIHQSRFKDKIRYVKD